MHSIPSVPVDKGLGFDFSALTDLAKSAATVGLDIYKQQMQLKQIKAIGNTGYMPNPSLPMSNAFVPQPTFGPQYIPPQSAGMGMGTMLAIGALVLGGAYMFMRR